MKVHRPPLFFPIRTSFFPLPRHDSLKEAGHRLFFRFYLITSWPYVRIRMYLNYLDGGGLSLMWGFVSALLSFRPSLF
jgi:hypothetical protein